MKEVKLCKCCGKELSASNKSGLCKSCYVKEHRSSVSTPRDIVNPVVYKIVRGKNLAYCPKCDSRIWHPGTEDFYCYHCGQKLM